MPAFFPGFFAIWIVSITFFLFSFGGDVFATPSITVNYSAPVSVTATMPFDTTLTINNASPGAKYFFKGISSDGSVSTYNSLTSTWLASTSAWLDMPSLTVGPSGSGSAILTTRYNSTATVSITSSFNVRIRKEGTGSNIDALSTSVLVNPLPTIPPPLPLTISYSLPATATADRPFTIPITITNALPEANYFLKSLGGDATSSANWKSVSTFNASSSSWLAWNGSWTAMPVLTVDSFGSGSASIQSRFNSPATVLGSNYFTIRIREDGSEENIDASPSSIFINPLPVVPPQPPLTINFSLPSTLTADLPLNLAISITNASPSSSYYLRTLGGISTASADLQSVSTYNGNSWLAWNGSWNSLPTINTDNFGSGSATIQTRFNSGSSTAGVNYFLVRLRLVGSDNNTDSSASAVTVNLPADTNGDSNDASPGFDFSLPQTASVGAQFSVNVKISGLIANTAYYLKTRLGLDSSRLTSGQTYNDLWLSDNDSWTKFPQITSDADGKWEGIILSRLASGKEEGTYKFLIRVRNEGTNDNFDSQTKDLKFTASSLSATLQLLNSPENLGTTFDFGSSTFSAVLGSNFSADLPVRTTKNNDSSLDGNNLISWGMTVFGAAVSSAFLRRREFAV